MNEYGRLNREKHQLAARESKMKKEDCTFTPKLLAKQRSFMTDSTIDRGVMMHDRALLGSALISKHRSNKDPIVLDAERS